MPDGMYERDALAWAEHQAALLRRLAAGERLNEPIDWLNVIQEVQDVGLSELRACESLLVQALRHLIKLHVFRDSRHGKHWHDEVAAFVSDAQRNFTPSMRQKIAMDALYAAAIRGLRKRLGSSADELPPTCPYRLDDFVDPSFDTDALLAKLSP